MEKRTRGVLWMLAIFGAFAWAAACGGGGSGAVPDTGGGGGGIDGGGGGRPDGGGGKKDGGTEGDGGGETDGGGGGTGVTNAAVRACDILLDTANAGVGSVAFESEVTGRFYKEGLKLGVSFMAKSDKPLAGKLATFKDAAGSGVDVTKLVVSKAQCYDRLGAVVADPGLTMFK